jgi:hypothetical protein
MEEKKQPLSLAINLGIIIGLAYCVLIFCQNQFFYANPLTFSLTKFLSYLIIIGGFVYAGYLSRKNSGGFISFKECLKTILIVIVITEVIYLIFSTLYIKFIDPGFMEKLKSSWQLYFTSHNVPQDKIDSTLARFKDAGKLTFGSLIQSLGFSIIIDAIFGVIIASILKKRKPEF